MSAVASTSSPGGGGVASVNTGGNESEKEDAGSNSERVAGKGALKGAGGGAAGAGIGSRASSRPTSFANFSANNNPGTYLPSRVCLI